MTVRLKKSVTQLAGIYNNRFEKLLLSLDEAVIDAGRKTEKQRMIEDSEQFEARRRLLMVEEVANKKREIAATAENAFLLQVESNFHETLLSHLEDAFNDTETIFCKILKFDENLGKLLDVLYTESCSISRLLQYVEQIPWLQESLMKFVRQPKYRRLDSSGNLVVLKTTRNVLSFVGIESLKTLLPILVAKHTMPLHSDFTPDLKKHMWWYAVGTANIAKALADKNKIRPHFGFNLGLFSCVGRTVVANIYLRTFDRKLTEQIIKARKKNNPNQAQALAALKPSHKYLISLWKKYADKITANIYSELNCRWLSIAPGFIDYSKIREISMAQVEKQDLHPFTKLLFTSQGYMQYKLLHKHGLMGKEQAMMYLRNFGVNSNDVGIISKINLTGIELNIAGIVEEKSNDVK